jgi:hypothetical protein
MDSMYLSTVVSAEEKQTKFQGLRETHKWRYTKLTVYVVQLRRKTVSHIVHGYRTPKKSLHWKEQLHFHAKAILQYSECETVLILLNGRSKRLAQPRADLFPQRRSPIIRAQPALAQLFPQRQTQQSVVPQDNPLYFL